MLEIVGDYTENPFQGMANDVPMMSLCRVIETDLREMLGETDLPPKAEAKNGILISINPHNHNTLQSLYAKNKFKKCTL